MLHTASWFELRITDVSEQKLGTVALVADVCVGSGVAVGVDSGGPVCGAAHAVSRTASVVSVRHFIAHRLPATSVIAYRLPHSWTSLFWQRRLPMPHVFHGVASGLSSVAVHPVPDFAVVPFVS